MVSTFKGIGQLITLGVALLGATGQAGRGAQTPFWWFEPDATMSSEDIQRMARGEVVVKPLSAKSGQLGVFAATELRQSPDVFVAWIRQISQLQRSKAIAASGRFSEPPVLQDLDGLSLDPRDLESLRECRPGDCALKLAASEIESLRRVADRDTDAALQQAFRRVLLDRLLAYRAGGLAAVPVPVNRSDTSRPTEVFAALHANSPYIRRSDVRLATWLNEPERSASLEVESFYYWSKEYYSSGKAVIAITHVGVTRAPRGGPAPEATVVGKQVFATRYMKGMLTHIALARDQASGALYMTYTNRAQLDVLKGFWGGLVRAIINSRLRGDAANVVQTLRGRIESGPPPP